MSRKAYSTESLPEAYVVRGLLLQAGIKAFIRNEYALGVMGELPFPETYPEVWIDDDLCYDWAREIIREYEAGQSAQGPDVLCAKCGEFSPNTFAQCWNCGAALDS